MKIIRCTWVNQDQQCIKYHDEEWGVPVYEDRKLLEYLILEAAQAGLNWFTILKKREAYRKVYSSFDPVAVAKYDENKKAELLSNSGIIRNKLKIESSISNAKAFLAIQKEYGSFKNYIWSFVNNMPIQNDFKSIEYVPSKTVLSDRISKDLKKRGFKFVGSTIIYAFMQAVGMVNDHLVGCFRYKELNAVPSKEGI